MYLNTSYVKRREADKEIASQVILAKRTDYHDQGFGIGTKKGTILAAM
jgi:hypothetical protein